MLKNFNKLIINNYISSSYILSLSQYNYNKFNFSSKSEGIYPGNVTIPYTSQMDIVDPQHHDKWPIYRVLDENGNERDDVTDFNFDEIDQDTITNWYQIMIRLQAFDDVFYNAQRQGRISFYMQNSGEEATHIGSAAALKSQDVVFSQYREAGVLMFRGFTLQQFADQCYSNCDDLGKGRQMPVHYGTNELNFQTISSPLTTQLPHAAGAAKAIKQAGEKDRCAAVYFGDGAASEGDFHSALNFAATTKVPCLFLCRNNGYAISTPIKDQYAGDGIISRAAGYGMSAIRVDGNDVFAVFNATREARRIAIEESRPVLIEYMSYRIGHHSTSDDSSRYRDVDEIKEWQTKDDPLKRIKIWMENKGWWDETKDEELRKEERTNVLKALETAENKPKPLVDELFTDVYHDIPKHLQEQQDELNEIMNKYPDYYHSSDH